MESGVRDPELCTMISRAPMENSAENPRKKFKNILAVVRLSEQN